MVCKQRADGEDHKCQNTDDGTDIIVLLVDGQLVQPSNEQIRLSCRGRKICNRIAS